MFLLLEIPNCLHNRFTHGGKVVTSRTGLTLLSGNILCLSLVLISVIG
jgi:hypothetical protein